MASRGPLLLRGRARAALRAVGEFLAFVAAYVALDWVSFLQPLSSGGITPWNPPPGLSLALLLLRGWWFAPAILLGALASELVVRGASTTLPHAAASSVWLAVSYGALAAWIRWRFASGTPDFHRVGDVSWFAGVVSPAVVAIGLGYVASLHLLGRAPTLPFARQLLQFWVGDAIGILVFTPALLVHRLGWLRPPRLGAEVVAQGLAVAGALWILWGFDALLAPRLFYVLFLPLIWIGVRHGIEGTTLALVGMQFGLVAGLQLAGYTAPMVLELQLLMLTLVFTGLLLGASVSERKRTERALRERQSALDNTLRLAAASETASALAHELFQPLSALASYVGAARLMLPRAEENRERLEAALAAAGRETARAGEVIRRLREFFQSGAKRLERVAVEGLIRDSLEVMNPMLLRRGVSLRVACDEEVGEIVVDRLQLESVIHQLVENAADAVTSGEGLRREIEIVARRVRQQVTIEVRDSGPGIAPELGEEIFSPFKTSKTFGTGLGLSISRTIVENHAGKLSVVSSPSGAVFTVALPGTGPEEEA